MFFLKVKCFSFSFILVFSPICKLIQFHRTKSSAQFKNILSFLFKKYFLLKRKLTGGLLICKNRQLQFFVLNSQQIIEKFSLLIFMLLRVFVIFQGWHWPLLIECAVFSFIGLFPIVTASSSGQNVFVFLKHFNLKITAIVVTGWIIGN